jgi:hypothetical protein
MKAISLRQPWADFVVNGCKTLELRTWQTAYRGHLAIHASKSVALDACTLYHIDPRKLVTGALIGAVELVDIIQVDELVFESRKDDHLAAGFFQPPLFGWVLTDPRRIDPPVPCRGHMSLFNVDLAPENAPSLPAAQTVALEPQAELAPNQVQEIDLDSRRPFELWVRPDPTTPGGHLGYRLVIQQHWVTAPAQPQLFGLESPGRKQVVELGGVALSAVIDAVLEALRLNGYNAPDLHANRRTVFHLTEESGVRLALLFLAVRPVSKVERIDAISYAIRSLSNEELYYWFSKCAHPDRSRADRAQKALRILVSEE